MITCLTLGDNGRLGNQLFQIAAVIGHAKHYNVPYAFKDWSYGKYFKNWKSDLVKGSSFIRKAEHTLDFLFLPLNTKDNHGTDLWGYFQSEKYFAHCEDEIRTVFEWDENKFNHLPAIGDGVIAIHIRRGDYVGNADYVNLSMQYYIDGVKFIQKNYPDAKYVLVFSDDIKWCKQHQILLASGLNITFSDCNVIEDLYLMSKCKYHVIANSSFSWWGAWLANSQMVVAPGAWLKGELQKRCTEEDLIPTHWVTSPVPCPKINALDLTFTIPVMFDHTDRIENLDACLKFITHNFNTNVIVSEQGQTKHFSEVAKKYGAQYVFNKTTSPHFERTKMLNQMAVMATTTYIANWDCDVIVRVVQIEASLSWLRNGIDMVYPYDGRFMRIDRSRLRDYLACLTVNAFEGLPMINKISDEEISYGGAVMFNKQSFIKGGMENQNMVSYGPEDYERYQRFKTLGFKVERCHGELFHFNHYIGKNSSGDNPYFAHNWTEYQKVKSLTTVALQDYIETWPWVIDANIYGAKFYDTINQDSIACAQCFMPQLLNNFEIHSVLDIGCGEGAWLSACGVDDVIGVDGDWVNEDRLLIAKEKFIRADVGQKLSIPKKFDLAVCLEVGEHLPDKDADQLVDNLIAHAPLILFGAAIPGQGGMNHINEQWQSYWAQKFIARGFRPVHHFRDNISVAYFYSQNAILYTNREDVYTWVSPIDYVSVAKYLEKLEQL